MTETSATAAPTVSVVVGGGGTESDRRRCLASITAQTLDPTTYEMIVVDPTRGSAARNLGLQRARGEFVVFLDVVDELTPESLERLSSAARSNRADIVLAPVGGNADPLPLLAVGRALTDLSGSDLLQQPGPYQLYRRDFLLVHDLQFPTDDEPLSDERFTTAAYLKTKRVSIIADHVCFLAGRSTEPVTAGRLVDQTLRRLAQVPTLVELVVAHTEADDLRRRLLQQLVSRRVLAILRGPTLLRLSATELGELLPTIRTLLDDVLAHDASVLDELPAIPALQTHLVRVDEPESLLRLVRRQHGDLRLLANVAGQRVVSGKLEMDVSCRLVHRDQTPVELTRTDGHFVLDPAFTQGLAGIGELGWVPTDPLLGTTLNVSVVDEHATYGWLCPVSVQPSIAQTADGGFLVVVTGHVRIDPRRLGGGLPAGTHPMRVSGTILGFSFDADLMDRRAPVTVRVAEDGRVVDRGGATLPRPVLRARRVARRLLPDQLDQALTRGSRSALRRLRSRR